MLNNIAQSRLYLANIVMLHDVMATCSILNCTGIEHQRCQRYDVFYAK